MKKVFLMKPIYVILSLIFVLPVFSQETIDHAKFRASYLFSYKTDSLQKEFVKTDLMYLDIGEETSKYYSRYTQIRDSNEVEGLKNGLSPHEIVENNRQFKGGVKTVIYQFVNTGEIYVSDVLVNRYCYNEKRILPEWTMGTGRKTIAGYACIEAEATYLGRKWIVYFAPDIPIHLGPWKLWGLPGLIVHATDSEHFFQFELQGFETLKDKKTIISDEWSNPCKKTNKQKFAELEKFYYQDFLGFTKSILMEGKGQVYLTPEQEQKHEWIKKKGGIPYIPLEK